MASASFEHQANAIRQIKQAHKRAASGRAGTMSTEGVDDELDYTARRVPSVLAFFYSGFESNYF